MKINKAKLLVGTLAIASVAATVGSISGTVAWFQYNTRATVEYQGASVHCTESLQVSVNGSTWKQTLAAGDIDKTVLNRSTRAANQLVPVTSGGLAIDSAPTDLYKNPIYQYAGAYPTSGDNNYWRRADKEDYVEFPVYLRVLDVDGAAAATPTLLAKKVYLSDVTIAAAVDGKDITDAVRVAIYTGSTPGTSIGTAYGTYATKDYSTDENALAVSGSLDLNNDGAVDTDQKYSFGATGTTLVYGDTVGSLTNPKAYAYKADVLHSGTGSTHQIANDADPYDIKGVALGTTTTGSAAMFAVTVRIYIEGWSELDGTKFGAKVDGTTTDNATNTKVWDVLKTKAAAFNVGLRFSAETHSTHAESSSAS
ncbi:MAG: hypothetical protein J6A47_10310 [Bacilli bacterium]|nr:hypothetical protein [Bacilli bacterium]MBO6285535.1 hypothetical protein [Bacilli bacterium]